MGKKSRKNKGGGGPPKANKAAASPPTGVNHEPTSAPENASTAAAPAPTAPAATTAATSADLDSLDAEILDLHARISRMGPTVETSSNPESKLVAISHVRSDGGTSEESEECSTSTTHDRRCGAAPSLINGAKLAKERELGEKLEYRELLAEEARVNSVVRTFETSAGSDPYDTDPDDHDRECPLCRDPWPLYDPDGRYHGNRRLCCGRRTCDACEEKHKASVIERATSGGKAVLPGMFRETVRCNFCRQPIPGNSLTYGPKEDEQVWRRRAEEGKTWAQFEVGRRYYTGYPPDQNFGTDRGMAARWYRKASERGNREAQAFLGIMHKEGLGVRRSRVEARRLFGLAAVAGSRSAQLTLGMMLLEEPRTHGTEKGKSETEAVKWLTLSAAQGDDLAQYKLGQAFQAGSGGLDTSKFRSQYWFRKAAEQGNARAQKTLSLVLVNIHKSRSDDGFPIYLHTGHNILPQALHWARRAQAGGAEGAEEVVSAFERMCLQSCQHCEEEEEECGRPLLRCTRCKAAAYCGAECQKAHWKEGHKIDCYQGAD